MKSGFVWGLFPFLFGISYVFAEVNEPEVIVYTKKIQVTKLDSKIQKKQPLEQWVVKSASKKKVIWEVNDCGESSGSGEQQDVSLCGSFTVQLSEVKTFTCDISVGSMNRGIIKDDSNWPHLFECFTRENPGGKYTSVNLHDLPSQAQ